MAEESDNTTGTQSLSDEVSMVGASSGEAQLRALEDEQARTDVRGGIFPGERQKILITAHRIQRTHNIGQDEQGNSVYIAAYARAQKGVRNPAARLQQLRDYYRNIDRRLAEASLRSDQNRIRALQREESAFRRGAQGGRSLAISPTTSATAIAKRYENVQKANAKSQADRARDFAKLSRRVAHTSYIVFFIIFAIAGLMDLLGLLKLAVEAVPFLGTFVGVLVNIVTFPVVLLCVTLPIIYVQYRIKRINSSTKDVHEYGEKLQAEAGKLHGALRPLMLEMRRPYLVIATQAIGSGGVGEFVRYQSRIWLNNLFVLALESIPYIDAGPWQLLKIWRVFVHQQKEFRLARLQMLEARAIESRITMMERFYLEYLEFAFQRSAARELGLRRSVRPALPASERAFSAAQWIAGRPPQQTAAPPPTMRDVAFAT